MTTFQKVLASTKSKGMCIYVGLLLLLSNYIIFVLICYFVRSGNVFVHVLYSMYSIVLVCFSMYSYLNKRVSFNGLRDIQLKETRKSPEGKNAPLIAICLYSKFCLNANCSFSHLPDKVPSVRPSVRYLVRQMTKTAVGI